jgi:predicted nucleic acid-binding protein
LIVIDASALTDFLLGRPEALEGVVDELGRREHEPLHSPELVEPETLNALRRLVHARAVPQERAAEAVADLGSTNLRRYPHAPFRERVWELRSELTAYDATYLALAEALGDSVLVTSDAGLAKRGRASLGGDRVFHVG